MTSLLDLQYERSALPANPNITEDILRLSSFYPSTSVQKSNAGGWQSVPHRYNYDGGDDPMIPLAEQVRELYVYLTRDMQLHSHVRKCMQMDFVYWFNVNNTNDANFPHNHIAEGEGAVYCALSGVYYLKKPVNSGNIVLMTDRGYYKHWYKDEFDTVVEAMDGDIIVFPPHIYHYVQPNLSDEPRVSVAFNLNIREV